MPERQASNEKSAPIPPSTAIVHAGTLLADRPDGQIALKRYLERNPGDTVLIHNGEEALHEVANAARVDEVSVEGVRASTDEEAAAEFAVARHSDRLEFAIDEAGVTNPNGNLLRWLTASEAMRLSRLPELDARIRAKLKAGCLALREGIRRVRIGNPRTLRRDSATELVPDPALANLQKIPTPSTSWSPIRLQPLAASQRAPSPVRVAASTRHSPWCRHSTPHRRIQPAGGHALAVGSPL